MRESLLIMIDSVVRFYQVRLSFFVKTSKYLYSLRALKKETALLKLSTQDMYTTFISDYVLFATECLNKRIYLNLLFSLQHE